MYLCCFFSFIFLVIKNMRFLKFFKQFVFAFTIPFTFLEIVEALELV